MAALAASLGPAARRYAVTSYPELSRYWPVPEWRLAVNPGHPIDAWLPVEAVAEAAAGTLTVPTVQELGRTAQDDEERAADDALDDYLATLLKADVLIPSAAPDPDPDAIGSGAFPWLVTQVSGDPTVTVFTSPEGFAAGFPAGTAAARVGFAELVANWPNPDWRLVVDPGAEVSFTLPGEQVPGLLLWTEEGASAPLPDPDPEQ